MGATAKQIAAQYIGAAQKHPVNRPEIFRTAAYKFMGLAQDPKNMRSAGTLAQIGLDFAAAATREQPVTMDDFTDLLRETQTAYDEVGDDPMDLVARRRDIHDARTPVTPGFTSIAPESFNKDATLGRSAVVVFVDAFPDVPPPGGGPTRASLIAQGITQSQNVAFWQGVKKEAQAMTVDVNLGFLPPLPPGFDSPVPRLNVRPFGEVEFGSDGNRTKIKFDLSFGTRLTVVGNYIAVTVGANPPMFFGTPAQCLTTPITVGASIGTFAAPSQSPLIYTAYVDALAPGAASALIPIPLKATQLLPIQSNLALTETYAIVFFDYGGNIITNQFYTKVSNQNDEAIPITGDVAFIRVFNEAGATSAHFRLPFQLAM
jgi:hypothetical protein